MKTLKKKEGDTLVRSATVRLSHAISLEIYKSDMELLSNKGLADRFGVHPDLVNIEQHLSYYTYTVTIDLERIGIDRNVEISNEEKIKRVNQLLDIIKVLNRDIRGREENLSPVFVIGGIYNINSPFYLGRIKLKFKDEKVSIDTDILKDTSNLTIGENSIYYNTKIGIIKNVFENEEEIKSSFEGKVISIEEFFEGLKNEIKEYYKS